MGTSQTKDDRVDIYYELSKPFYYAGEYIQGNVYLNIKADTEYSALYVKLECRQNCRWTEGSQRNRVTFTGNLKTFENEFIIANFGTGVKFGQYTFPFSMRTSPAFPGSFTDTYNNRQAKITYSLKAYLADYSGQYKPQEYIYNVTILEPPRIISGVVATKSFTNPQVCGCCDQGTTRLEVIHSKNVVRGGDVIGLGIKVDNKECKLPMRCTTVKFNRNVFVQSEDGVWRWWPQALTDQVTPGTPAEGEAVYNIQVPVTKLNYSTAIGRTVAHYFSVEVESEAEGSCLSRSANPKTFTHIYVQSPNPNVQGKVKIDAPPNWNPILAPKKIYDVEPKYAFAPNPRIAVMNRMPKH